MIIFCAGKGMAIKGLFKKEISANEVAPALVIQRSDILIKLIKFSSKQKILFSIFFES